MSKSYILPVILAGLFIVIWIVWASQRTPNQKRGITGRQENTPFQSILEILAVIDAAAFFISAALAFTK